MASLELDFLQRIINVHWGGKGTVFVYGCEGGEVFTVKFKTSADSEPTKQQTATLRRIVGCSYASAGTSPAVPTFLMAGTRGEKGDVVILKSDDGLTWADGYAFDQVTGFDTHLEVLSAVVYDPVADQFFMALVHADSSAVGTSTSYNRHYSSTDGTGWSQVYEHLRSTAGTSFPEISPFPSEHCSHNELTDVDDHYVPDGVVSRIMTEQDNLKMLPMSGSVQVVDYHGGGTGFVDQPSGSITIKNIKPVEGEEPPPATVSFPMGRVTCVAGANKIWMAGGWEQPDYSNSEGDGPSPGQLYFSIDNGETWKFFSSAPSQVICICAAPLEDIEPDEPEGGA